MNEFCNDRVVILAAGKGSRLKNYTKNTPKTLLKIGNTSCFEEQLKIYQELKFNNISVVTGFASEAFLKYPSIQSIFNPHWKQTNMLTSLLIGFSRGSVENTIISYGDIIFEKNAVEKLCQSQHKISILYDINFLQYWNKRTDNPLSDLESFKIKSDGQITEIGLQAKTSDEIEGQYMGIFKITIEGLREIFEYISKKNIEVQNELSMTEFFNDFISEGGLIHGIPYSGKWCEVDTPKDLTIAREIFGN